MGRQKYLMSLWKELDGGERLYPYTGVRGPKKGLYSVSFSGKSDEYQGVSEADLIAAVESGRFFERGTIRMLPLDAAPGAERNGYAPTHYKGVAISTLSTQSQRLAKMTAIFPDELSSSRKYAEGAVKPVLVNAFERSSAARDKCIKHFGAICKVCDIDFGLVYGEIGVGFIHVHHTRPLSTIAASYKVDPIEDLVPVCPNCHAMLHRSDPPLSIHALRTLIRKPNDVSFHETAFGNQ